MLSMGFRIPAGHVCPGSRWALPRRCSTIVVHHGCLQHLRSSPTTRCTATAAIAGTSRELLTGWLQLSEAECDRILSSIDGCSSHERQLASNLQLLCSWRSQQPRLRTWLKQCPHVLSDVDICAWYDFLSAFGYTRINFVQILVHHPEVLQQGSLFNAGSVIMQLQSLGLSERAITDTILPYNPLILLLHPTQQLQPLLQHLQQLGVPLDGVRDLISRAPWMLTLEQPLAAQLEFFNSLGFTAGSLTQLVSRDASVLLQDVTSSLGPKVGFLQEAAGYTGDDLVTLLAADPQLLSQALPGLQRKHEFLVRVMCLGPAAVLQQYPRYYSESLLHKIGPRYSYVVTHHLQQLVAAAAPAPATATSSSGGTEGSSSSSSSSGSSMFRGHPVANNKLLPAEWRGKPSASSITTSSSSSSSSGHEPLRIPPGAPSGQGSPGQQQHQQQEEVLLPGGGPAGTAPAACAVAAARVDLSALLSGDDAVWAAGLGLELQEYAAFAADWAAGEGLHWSGVRAAF